MSQSKTVSVAGQTDIVLLRMSVRDAARTIGLSLADQARISLAASSVVEASDVSGANPGQATIEACDRDGRVGTQVTYVTRDDNREQWPQMLNSVKWMVDELVVDKLPDNQVQVTLIKWKA